MDIRADVDSLFFNTSDNILNATLSIPSHPIPSAQQTTRSGSQIGVRTSSDAFFRKYIHRHEVCVITSYVLQSAVGLGIPKDAVSALARIWEVS
jgi:hypothetical protein